MYRLSAAETNRPGAALIALVVTLAIVALLVGTIARQHLAHRKFLTQREEKVQTHWLARAGIELAVGKLLADPAYPGEVVDLVPDTQVRVRVTNEASSELFRILCEVRAPSARPTDPPHSLSRQFRRVSQGGKVRMEPLHP